MNLLLYACSMDAVECVRCFLEVDRVDVNEIYKAAGPGAPALSMTAMDVALSHGNERTVEVLRNGGGKARAELL